MWVPAQERRGRGTSWRRPASALEVSAHVSLGRLKLCWAASGGDPPTLHVHMGRAQSLRAQRSIASRLPSVLASSHITTSTPQSPFAADEQLLIRTGSSKAHRSRPEGFPHLKGRLSLWGRVFLGQDRPQGLLQPWSSVVNRENDADRWTPWEGVEHGEGGIPLQPGGGAGTSLARSLVGGGDAG